MAHFDIGYFKKNSSRKKIIKFRSIKNPMLSYLIL